MVPRVNIARTFTADEATMCTRPNAGNLCFVRSDGVLIADLQI